MTWSPERRPRAALTREDPSTPPTRGWRSRGEHPAWLCCDCGRLLRLSKTAATLELDEETRRCGKSPARLWAEGSSSLLRTGLRPPTSVLLSRILSPSFRQVTGRICDSGHSDTSEQSLPAGRFKGQTSVRFRSAGSAWGRPNRRGRRALAAAHVSASGRELRARRRSPGHPEGQSTGRGFAYSLTRKCATQ